MLRHSFPPFQGNSHPFLLQCILTIEITQKYYQILVFWTQKFRAIWSFCELAWAIELVLISDVLSLELSEEGLISRSEFKLLAEPAALLIIKSISSTEYLGTRRPKAPLPFPA